MLPTRLGTVRLCTIMLYPMPYDLVLRLQSDDARAYDAACEELRRRFEDDV
jgi:hypothetical protein